MSGIVLMRFLIHTIRIFFLPEATNPKIGSTSALAVFRAARIHRRTAFLRRFQEPFRRFWSDEIVGRTIFVSKYGVFSMLNDRSDFVRRTTRRHCKIGSSTRLRNSVRRRNRWRCSTRSSIRLPYFVRPTSRRRYSDMSSNHW